MKVFLDANVLVSLLNKEYPLFSITSRIVSFAAIEVLSSRDFLMRHVLKMQ